MWVSPAQPGDTFSRIKGSTGFKRNGEKHTKGLTGFVYWTAERSRIGERPTARIPLGDFVEWTPLLGVEYENAISAAADIDEGYTP